MVSRLGHTRAWAGPVTVTRQSLEPMLTFCVKSCVKRWAGHPIMVAGPSFDTTKHGKRQQLRSNSVEYSGERALIRTHGSQADADLVAAGCGNTNKRRHLDILAVLDLLNPCT